MHKRIPRSMPHGADLRVKVRVEKIEMPVQEAEWLVEESLCRGALGGIAGWRKKVLASS